MRYTITEQKALKKLGIPDFTHMTKDKVAKFVTMLPKMNPEVAKAAIDKFPEFKELTLGIVNNYKASLDNILSANSESQKSFYDACNEIISSLQKELEDNSLTAEEKDRIENKLLIVADMINKKDSENKHQASPIRHTISHFDG